MNKKIATPMQSGHLKQYLKLLFAIFAGAVITAVAIFASAIWV
jgi:hypothetical protein